MVKTYSLKPAEDSTVSYSIPYERLLNPQQFDAVSSFKGPVLCIAGAGSGKTRTLIYRVARMIESGIPPEKILLLTFTRKAAQNMLKRVAEIIDSRARQVAGGTYHSFAAMTLRTYGHLIKIPAGFSILDESDSADLVNLLRNELELNKKESRFPQKKTIIQIFSKAANLELGISKIVEDFYPQFSEHAADIERLHQAFADYKIKNALLDYDDLLIFLLKLLEESEEARVSINSKYRYIMADEYQDTNGLQAKITLLLGGNEKNIMVVGDDSQSIYSFRGARIRNILEFPGNFENCRIIKLERNYRSTSTILKAANSLMNAAKEGFQKKLFTEKLSEELPALVRCRDEDEQSLFIASRILELREQSIPLSKIAVLFRSSFHAYQLELELKRRNIPYVKWGGFKFLETAHLKDVIAHLRIVHNPYDKVSWLRVLLLIEGIGTQSAETIFNQLGKESDPFDFSNTKTRPVAAKGLQALEKMLKSAVATPGLKPDQLLERVADYYFPLLKKKFDDYPRRFKDVDQLALIAQKFASLSDFLSELALEPPRDSVNESMASETDDECLILSTIHSAKGLEWHSTFVIHALEGRFPAFNAMKTEAEIEEERRLMYVAMTRAEENLAITVPMQLWDPASGTLLARPSRFIDEIGTENFEIWQISQ